MNIKAIKIFILNIVFLYIVQLSFSQENILPIKKPFLSVEIIEKKVSKNFLIPLKKPILEKKKEKITEIKKKKEEKKHEIIIIKNTKQIRTT